MPRRDRHIVLALATLSVAFAIVQSVTAISPDVLLAVPALLLLMPLLPGRPAGRDQGGGGVVSDRLRTVAIALSVLASRSPATCPTSTTRASRRCARSPTAARR